jgi:ketosteroid isomerase-like protein
LKTSFQSNVYDASKLLADIYRSKNFTDSAFKYLELMLAAKDSFYSEEKLKQLQNLSFNEQLRQQEIQQTVVKMFQAMSDRDSIALKSYCSPDVTFYEYGQIWNIDTFIRKAVVMNQSADFERTNSFEFINTESGKTSALVTYRLSSVIIKDAKKTNIQWLETVVLTKQRKLWKVKHLHSTMLKRD